MEDFGLVSIITPSYNCADFIEDTIRSIQAQTYNNWELLITDDCSTDNTREIIRSLANKDSRIKLFCLVNNSGAGIARNNSIKEANGRYIAFCDSDDRWLPEKLEKQLHFMEKKDCCMSYTSYMTCHDTGEPPGIVISRRRETLSSMKRDDKMGFLTVIYDTSRIGKVYMPVLRKRQDWALKLKILQTCHFAYGMKEPLAIYRLRKDSISHDKWKLVKYNIAVYREVFGWSKFRSSLFFLMVFMPSYLLKKFELRRINR